MFHGALDTTENWPEAAAAQAEAVAELSGVRKVYGEVIAHGFPDGLKVREVLDLVRAHYPHPRTADDLLDAFELGSLAGRMASKLCGGQARRVAVALAFAGDPELVLLDEPSTGLDLESRRQVWERVRALVATGEKTVLLTSHYMDEIEALADRVAVLLDGRVAVEGTVGEMKHRVRQKIVSFESEVAPQLEGVVRLEFADGRHHLFTEDADALVRRLVANGTPFADIEVSGAALEEALLDITRRN